MWSSNGSPLLPADHKRRKLDSHSSPSHSSSVKVSMAWGRLYPFLLYLPERSLPLHIPAALKTTEESCHRNAGSASGSPRQIRELSRKLWTSTCFPESHGKKPQGLSQGDDVYIEYFFHIEILIYFHKMETVSVPWQEEIIFLKHFYITCGFFFFFFLTFSK